MKERGDLLAGIKHKKDNDWPPLFLGKKKSQEINSVNVSQNFCRAFTDLEVLKIKGIVS